MNEIQQAPGQQAHPGVTRLNIIMEECEGGVLLVVANPFATDEKRTAVVPGNPETDLHKRRVQKKVLKWMREFFPAPPRKGSKAAEQAAQEAQAMEPAAE